MLWLCAKIWKRSEIDCNDTRPKITAMIPGEAPAEDEVAPAWQSVKHKIVGPGVDIGAEAKKAQGEGYKALILKAGEYSPFSAKNIEGPFWICAEKPGTVEVSRMLPASGWQHIGERYLQKGCRRETLCRRG